jgi:hypothetical protein
VSDEQKTYFLQLHASDEVLAEEVALKAGLSLPSECLAGRANTPAFSSSISMFSGG